MSANGPTRREFEEWKDRVKALEDKFDRVTMAILGVFILVVGTIITSLIRTL